jgi:hypothetical protein
MGFAPPPYDGFALLASAHGCAWLATNTPYMGSQPHAILFGGFSPQRVDASVCLCAMRCLMPALLPVADEFWMNSEGLGTFFSTDLLFCAAFLRVGGELCRERGSPVSRDLRSHIGSVLGAWPTREP